MSEQMSERDDLARVMHGPGHGGVCMLCTEHADAALVWFAQHRGPRIVSSVQELNDLRVFAAVLTGVTDTGQRYVWQKGVWNDWHSLLGSYSPDRLIRDFGTLTVVFDPESEGR